MGSKFKRIRFANQFLSWPQEKGDLPILFQLDKDPKHTSRNARSWFENKNVNVLEWPAQSPDLNPIENLWSGIKKYV